ncbi:MAG: hypothetical protein ACKOYJ_12260, partial [Planctomycetia bacterium]
MEWMSIHSLGIQVALVVPQQFQVLEPCPARQEVVGDVQDVIRLVVRQVNLEQAEAVIDRAIKLQPLRQECTAPTPGDRSAPVSGRFSARVFAAAFVPWRSLETPSS